MAIWDELNTKTLFGSQKATAEQVNRQEKDIHLEQKNRELLTDVNLINTSLMRGDGGVIPGSGTIKTVQVSDDTRTAVWTSNPGELWVLNSVSAEVTNIAGSLTYTFFMTSTETGASVAVRWFYYASTGASPVFQSDADFPDMPMYFDENIEFQFTITGAGSFDTVDMHACIFRIR